MAVAVVDGGEGVGVGGRSETTVVDAIPELVGAEFARLYRRSKLVCSYVSNKLC